MTGPGPVAEDILDVMDACADAFSFPMFDNGYVYLAATRLTLNRSESDWAMVVEVFGFSPRAGLPDTAVQTFASRLHNRNPPEQYVTREAYERYLENNPNNEFRPVWPIAEGNWQDPDDVERVADGAGEVVVRGKTMKLPPLDEYGRQGIELQQPPTVMVFELCRYLADVARDAVLATAEERRVSVPPELTQVLRLDEWHHPDLASGERPSESETFQQLAHVLATGDVRLYRPTVDPNTHWRHWPDGGSL